MRSRLAVGIMLFLVASSLSVGAIGVAGADPACTGLQVTPSQNLATVVESAPAGTTICIAAGVYQTGEIWVSDNTQLIGAPGAVLDGGGRFGRAIANYHRANNVLIQGLEIEHYANTYAPEDSVIGAWGGSGWVIDGNHVHDNASSGIGVGSATNTTVKNNLVDHNGCGGIMGGGTGTTVSGNEVAYNNTGGFDGFNWSCGGGKANICDSCVYSNNYSHDNNGWGFWFDFRNTKITFSGNRVENNAAGGILFEINGATGPSRIIGNSFSRNGTLAPNAVMFGTAIDIAASNNVEIANNLIDATNKHGITLNYSPRGDAPDLSDRDISVHDNSIGLRTGAGDPHDKVGRVGFYTDTNGSPVPPGVSFVRNTYYFNDSTGLHFSLPSATNSYGLATFDQWQAAGFDAGSSVRPASSFPSTGAAPAPSPSPSPSASPSPSPSPSPSASPSPSSSPSPSPSLGPNPSPAPTPSSSPSPSPSPSSSPSPSPSPRSPSPSPSPAPKRPRVLRLSVSRRVVTSSTTMSFDLTAPAAVSAQLRDRHGNTVAIVLPRHWRTGGNRRFRLHMKGRRLRGGWYRLRVIAIGRGRRVGTSMIHVVVANRQGGHARHGGGTRYQRSPAY